MRSTIGLERFGRFMETDLRVLCAVVAPQSRSRITAMICPSGDADSEITWSAQLNIGPHEQERTTKAAVKESHAI
jgi:hypothetical protein